MGHFVAAEQFGSAGVFLPEGVLRKVQETMQTLAVKTFDGSDPDGTDGDDNPDESSDTETTLTEAGSIGIAKREVRVNLGEDGCTEVVYELNIENFGNVALEPFIHFRNNLHHKCLTTYVLPCFHDEGCQSPTFH